MGKMSIDDFVRYAKEQFGVEVTLEENRTPDTFENLFGESFLEKTAVTEKYEEQFMYNGESVQVNLMKNAEEQNKYILNMNFAA